jgi:hypothetical protein
MTRPRIGIALPVVAMKSRSIASLCMNLVTLLTHEIEASLLIVEGAYIQHNRALLVEYAQAEACSHIFFMDHDMSFPRDTVVRLLGHERDVVGGAYNQRGIEPPLTTVYLADAHGARTPVDQLPTELFRCEAIGCGCLLVRMTVFDRIAAPWFQIVIEDNTRLVQTEDVWFCNQVRQARLDVWCDPTIPIGHVGEKVY